jgi:hypothetical protein
MAKYNMINSSSFTSNTTSGTGNRNLTATELYSLIDGVLDTTEVTLTGSDILCLDIDLGYRLKIDSILLYAGDLTKLSNINFYFKNYEADSYTTCSKSSSINSYVGTAPSPSAPRYIRCTVSGIDIGINELQVLNDDNIIAFGVDGNVTDTMLEDAPEGVYGDIQSIEIYNNTNSDMPANAYVCVDYTGKIDDTYIDISSTEDGSFYNLSDGDFTETWRTSGTHNGTKIVTGVGSALLCLSNSEDAVVKGYLGELPNILCTYPKKPFGVYSATAFDHVTGRLYVAFWPGVDTTGSAIDLWYYIATTNVWVFRGTLVSSLWNTNYISMCCDDNGVYFLTTISPYTTIYILKHTSSGALGNLVTLSTFTISSTSPQFSYFYIIADFKGNIWIKSNYNPYTDVRSLFKFVISTLVITSMSNSFYNVSGDQTSTPDILTYDVVRDRIYSMHVEHSTYTNGYYLEMYDVVSNTWTTQYLNYGNITGVNTNYYMSFCCHNEILYFHSANYDGIVYIYNLNTGIKSTVPVGFHVKTGISNKVIALDPLTLEDTYSLLVIGGYTDDYSVFGYNNSFITNTLITGVYTSPIIALEDPNSASYFKIETSSTPGITNVSRYSEIQDGIIEVRSSTTSPLPVEAVFWSSRDSSYVTNARIDCNTMITSYYTNIYGYLHSVAMVSFCRQTSNIIVLYIGVYYSTYHTVYIKYDLLGNQIKYLTWQTYVGYITYMVCDNADGIWVYDTNTETLKHYDHNFVLKASVFVQGFRGLCNENLSGGAWYTSSVSKSLVHIDYNCNTVVVKALTDPYEVCETLDNGCWVIDLSDTLYGKTIKRYSTSGELIITIKVTKLFKKITADLVGGFYALSFDSPQCVDHYDKEGNLTMSIKDIYNETHISGGSKGVILYSSTLLRVRYVSLQTKNIVWTKFNTGLTYPNGSFAPPILATFRIEDQQKYTDVVDHLPLSYDPLWNLSTGTLPWKDVDKDGYFLIKKKYHQVRLTLSSNNHIYTPYVLKAIMAPAVCISNILPHQSKPLFVRSNIPQGSEAYQTVTRIKVWWDVETV